MAKKIVVLNGSPRKNGNTSALVNAFTKGAEENGNSVVNFFVSEMNIHPCKGCCAGGKNPDSPCTQKDDMDKIYPKFKEADIVVLASPLYYWNISGQLKCAFDRLYAVAETDKNYKGPPKNCILIMAAEGNGFEEAIRFYNGLVKYLGWKSIGQILAGGVVNIGDINGKPELEEARKMGLSIK
jgi:multimeric flavodoxin WrbA